MAKTVTRVNGRGGESMWCEDDKVCFKSGNTVHTEKREDFEFFDVVNVEKAREKVGEARDVVGAWTEAMEGTKGKTVLLAGGGRGFCWVMETNKNQSPSAIGFAREICAAEEEEDLEYKLYAAIQTPKGAVFTIGSIGCTLGAYFVLSNFQNPIVALILAGLAIFMFVNIK